jgi:transposase, IS6 family
MTAGAWTRRTSRVKGKWRYLYRAVDSTGATLDFLLSAKQDAVAAKRFLVKALEGANHLRHESSTPTATPHIRPPLRSSKPKAIWPRIAGIGQCHI